MTRRGWWTSAAVATAAILGSGLWAHQATTPATPAACSSCDARHQNLADRAKAASGAPTLPLPTVPSE